MAFNDVVQFHIMPVQINQGDGNGSTEWSWTLKHRLMIHSVTFLPDFVPGGTPTQYGSFTFGYTPSGYSRSVKVTFTPSASNIITANTEYDADTAITPFDVDVSGTLDVKIVTAQLVSGGGQAGYGKLIIYYEIMPDGTV